MTAKRSQSISAPAGSPYPDSALCQFPFADGRRCRMLRASGHPSLCLFHARDEQQLVESTQLGAELAASLSGRFLTATDINFVLGKLFTALAQNRIPARNAAILAYIGQLMLHAIPTIRQEYKFRYPYESWNHMVSNAVTLSGSEPDTVAAVDPSDDSPGSSADEPVRTT